MKVVSLVSLAGLLLLLPLIAPAQGTEPDIHRYITRINDGLTDQVRGEIPSLLAQYPNNPGVLYLQGLVTTDGAEAVRIYQSIVDNFPKSEWADDALYKVYQFYYALGLYRTAEIKLTQLKTEYPSSPFATGKPEPETKHLAEQREQPAPPPRQVADTSVQVPASVEPPAPALRFALQVGAFTTQVNADKQKQFFEQLGYPVEVLSKVKDNRSLFLVWVGGYSTYDEAKASGSDIKKKYKISSIVISK